MTFEEKTGAGRVPEQAPDDALRAMVATIVQETIHAEFAQFLGAEPYERTTERRGYRNGSYVRALNTRVGTLTLSIPRDR